MYCGLGHFRYIIELPTRGKTMWQKCKVKVKVF